MYKKAEKNDKIPLEMVPCDDGMAVVSRNPADSSETVELLILTDAGVYFPVNVRERLEDFGYDPGEGWDEDGSLAILSGTDEEQPEEDEGESYEDEDEGGEKEQNSEDAVETVQADSETD